MFVKIFAVQFEWMLQSVSAFFSILLPLATHNSETKRFKMRYIRLFDWTGLHFMSSKKYRLRYYNGDRLQHIFISDYLVITKYKTETETGRS